MSWLRGGILLAAKVYQGFLIRTIPNQESLPRNGQLRIPIVRLELSFKFKDIFSTAKVERENMSACVMVGGRECFVGTRRNFTTTAPEVTALTLC